MTHGVLCSASLMSFAVATEGEETMFQRSPILGRRTDTNPPPTALDTPHTPTAMNTSSVADRTDTTHTPLGRTPPISPAAESKGSKLIVGPNIKLKGAEILDCDTLVVEGHVEATIDCRLMQIAANGSFSGKVTIDVAEVTGRFDGELLARQKLVIRSTGKVDGKVQYGALVIEEGGVIGGDVHATADHKHDKPTTSSSSTGSSSSFLTAVKP